MVNCGLNQPAKDAAIWNYAKHQDFTIVTNDEDFIDLLTMKGFPPKIILLRTGNHSTKFLQQKLIIHHEKLIEFEQQNIYGLIEIY